MLLGTLLRAACDDVTDQLRQELSMIQAYADPNLVSRARREGWSGENTMMLRSNTENQSMHLSGGKGNHQTAARYSEIHRMETDNAIDMALNNERCSIEGQDEKRKRSNRTVFLR